MGFFTRNRQGDAGGVLTERPRLPAHVAYVHWGFAQPLAKLEWDLSVLKDPGTTSGEYMALFNGAIDGSAFYLGLQTDLSLPSTGQGAGKGLIFSTWWTFDEADTEVAPGGFREMGTHEGRFVGVRQVYPWSKGDYRVVLARRGPGYGQAGEVASDWFDLFVTPLAPLARTGERPAPAGEGVWCGGLRFRRRRAATPAAVEPGGLMFAELYSRVANWGSVPAWHLDLMAYGDGAPCPEGRTEYPAFPFGQRMPNVSACYDPVRRRVRVQMGGTGVQAPAAPWRQAQTR